MIISCPSCGQKNRVHPTKFSEGRCGSCKAALTAPTHPIEVDTATFDALSKSVDLPLLVDFWAPWCGPCRAAAPEVAKAAQSLAGRALVLKINTEQHQDIAARLQIRGIPYFAVFQRGKKIAEHTGMTRADTLVRLVP